MKIKNLLLWILSIGCISLVGAMDYEDALLQEKHYCDNVAAGVWPAYDSSIKCPTEK